MKYLNKYTYLLLGLIIISGITFAFIIPNFQREEFSQDVIDDIIEGVTTTSTTSVENDDIEVIENNEQTEDEEDLIITDEEINKIEKLLINNKVKKEITDFDVYMLIGSDERSGETLETRGKVFGKRADVIILGLINKTSNQITLLSYLAMG